MNRFWNGLSIIKKPSCLFRPLLSFLESWAGGVLIPHFAMWLTGLAAWELRLKIPVSGVHLMMAFPALGRNLCQQFMKAHFVWCRLRVLIRLSWETWRWVVDLIAV